MTDPAKPNFDGHGGEGDHRTLGPHRAWCSLCQEYCYPSAPCGEPKCCAEVAEPRPSRVDLALTSRVDLALKDFLQQGTIINRPSKGTKAVKGITVDELWSVLYLRVKVVILFVVFSALLFWSAVIYAALTLVLE